MAGLLSFDPSVDVNNPPSTIMSPWQLGLLNAAAGAGQYAGASRLPIGLGQVIGGAAGGYARGYSQGLQNIGQAQQNQSAALQNQLQRMNLQGYQRYFGLMNGANSGVGSDTTSGSSTDASDRSYSPGSISIVSNGRPTANAFAGGAGMPGPLARPPQSGTSPASIPMPSMPGPAPAYGLPATASAAPSSTQPPPLFGVPQLGAQIRTLMSFPAGQPIAAKLLELLPKTQPGTYLGQDGSLQMLPNAGNVLFQQGKATKAGEGAGTLQYAGPISAAQEWAKVAPTIAINNAKPVQLYRPGAGAYFPTTGQFLQVPNEIQTVDPKTGQPLTQFVPLGVVSSGPNGGPNGGLMTGAPSANSAASGPPATGGGLLNGPGLSQQNVDAINSFMRGQGFNGGAPAAAAPSAPVATGNVPTFPRALPPARAEAETEAGKDFGTVDKKGYDAANITLANITSMVHSLDTMEANGGWLTPGAGADVRGDLAKWVNTLATMSGSKPLFDANTVANQESFNKLTKLAGMQVVSQFFGGQREAASIINGATGAVPNAENTYLGGRLVASGIEQAARRQVDLYNYKAQLLAQNKGLVGADSEFNRLYPPSLYTDRAIANAVPDGAVTMLQGNPKLSAEFDAKYGKGIASFVLRGGRTQLGRAGAY